MLWCLLTECGKKILHLKRQKKLNKYQPFSRLSTLIGRRDFLFLSGKLKAGTLTWNALVGRQSLLTFICKKDNILLFTYYIRKSYKHSLGICVLVRKNPKYVHYLPTKKRNITKNPSGIRDQSCTQNLYSEATWTYQYGEKDFVLYSISSQRMISRHFTKKIPKKIY